MTVKDFLQTFDEFAEMTDDELIKVLMKKIPCEKCRYSPNGLSSNSICKNPTKPYDEPQRFVTAFGFCKRNLYVLLYSTL